MTQPTTRANLQISRRTALKTVGLAAGWTIVPRTVLGRGGQRPPPSDRLTIACVGVGSQGLRVMMDFLRHDDVQVVAVCDVNRGCDEYNEWSTNELRDKVRKLLGDEAWGGNGPYRGGIAGREPAREIVDAYYGARTRSGQYTACRAVEDYRELLANSDGIDAVVIGTPDHLHAPVAIAAMRAGRHVFCQKPMAHTVHESARMAEVSRETGLATQVAVGNQASEATRQLCEWVWSGAIGAVREVVNWSDRPYWPQGIEAPAAADPVPDYLNWNLWLGPTAMRPYSRAYQPFIWRGWYDFGTGALGDMGCYSFDTIFRVLKLEAPAVVEAATTERHEASFPKASLVYFDFPARGEMPPVRVTWYDGGLRPPRPRDLDEDSLAEVGLMFVGETGTILCGFNGARPRLIPAARMRAFTPPPPSLPRSPGNDREWIDACRGGKPGGANFDFESRVTDAVLLGNIAVRTGGRLTWDSRTRNVDGAPEAARFLRADYREGWDL